MTPKTAMIFGRTNITFPWASSYDYYVSETEYNSTPELNRNLLMLKALVLSDEQIAKYGDLLDSLSNSQYITYSEQNLFRRLHRSEKHEFLGFLPR